MFSPAPVCSLFFPIIFVYNPTSAGAGLSRCSIVANGRFGIRVKTQAELKLSECAITDHSGSGVLVENSCRVIYDDDTEAKFERNLRGHITHI